MMLLEKSPLDSTLILCGPYLYVEFIALLI